MKKFPVSMPFLLLALLPSLLQAANDSVVKTRHNLSASGPAALTANGQPALRSTLETRVCIFCHTPHHANKDSRLEENPLWSRPVSNAEYDPYYSSTMSAVVTQLPGQPTGTSRLCLSCHDGTVALGRLHSGQTLPGITSSITSDRASYLGTDLRNDHPISFPYDSPLHSKDLELKDPSQLPAEVRLEKGTNFVQCTTCHDPHRDPIPLTSKFLVIPNYKNGTQLCIACHAKQGWSTNIHSSSLSTKDDGCEICHRPHGANSVYYPPLLRARYEYASIQPYQDGNLALCLGCHPETTILDPLHPERTNFAPHYKHVVSRGIPCLACHPSHGVPDSGVNHRHLIDFSPLFAVTGIYYSDTRNCNVVCHTASHLSNPKYY
jgi:hypothetical protein